MKAAVGLRLLVGLLAALGSVGAMSHHSFAMFDMSQARSVEGTVRNFEFSYPHVWLWIDVQAEGSAVTWGIESAGPAELNRVGGWTRSSLKVGDKVIVRFSPLKNGKNGGVLLSVRLPDGHTLPGQLPATVSDVK